MRQGKLILLTGYSGAGKTTMAKVALKNISNMQYFKMTTNRPPRMEDVAGQSLEYNFVDDALYKKLQANPYWEDRQLEGYHFGSDVLSAQNLLNQGVNLLRCVFPDKTEVHILSSKFKRRPILIWIDTPLSVANQRLTQSSSKLRRKRLSGKFQNEKNATEIKSKADYVFSPIGSLVEDDEAFVEFLRSVIV